MDGRESFLFPPAGVRGTISGVRILVVDDDSTVASMCEQAFPNEHDIVTVSSGFRALDLIAVGRSFDVILCELRLPDMTGMEVHKRLVDCAPRTAGKIVFLTDDAKAYKAFLDSVPNMYVQKPVLSSALRQLVRDASLR